MMVAMWIMACSSAFAYSFGSTRSVNMDGVTYYVKFDATAMAASIVGVYDSYNQLPAAFTIPSFIAYDGANYKVVNFDGDYTYNYLDNVTSVTFPSTVESIGACAFSMFRNVKEFDIPATVTSLNGNVNSGRDYTKLIMHSATVPEGEVTNYSSYHLKMVVPGASFMSYLEKYKNVYAVVADNLDDADAFTVVKTGVVDDGELGHIVVQDILPEIRTYSQVNKLIVESGHINTQDFYDIRQMKNLVYLDLSGLSIEEIPDGALEDCWQIETVLLPSTVKTIGSSAFRSTGITAISLPDGLVTIKDYAFRNCDFLNEIVFPNTVKSLPYYCCYGSDNLHYVTLPDALTYMDSYAFASCDIYSINIPGTLKRIPDYAFHENRNLAVLTLNEGTEEIGNNSFGYAAITALTLPSSMRTLDHSFYNCKKLADLNLNEGLERITYYAFQGCESLTKLVLPSSLLYLTDYPFYDCPNIKTIDTYALIPPTVKNNVITYNAGNIKLNVPMWSYQEYMTTPGWLEFQDNLAMTEHLPQNINITKDFEFVLRQGMLDKNPDYKPNMKMMYNVDDIDDGFGHTKRERGNLTVASTSGMLNVNDFSMYLSPYAKYYADESRFYWDNDPKDYDYWRTDYNPTCLVVKGQMRAETQTINLMCRNDLWQFISFPFDVNMKDIVPVDENTQWVVRTYDGNARANQNFDNTWVNLTSDDQLKAGRGYILKCYNDANSSSPYLVEFTVKPANHNVTGQRLFTNTDLSAELNEYNTTTSGESVLAANRSWNLIGNQYPSFFDTRYLDTEASFLVWDSYNRTYAAFNVQLDNYVLNPGEAFFMQRPVDANDNASAGTLKFRKEGRQIYRNPNDLTVTDPSHAKAKGAGVNANRVLNIAITDGVVTDRTRIVFNENASLRYEAGKDLPKFMSDNMDVPQIWSMGGTTEYSLNFRPEEDGTVELTVRTGAKGSFTISLANESNESVCLLDRQTGVTTAISNVNGYTFQTDGGVVAGRFAIVAAGTTGIDAVATQMADDNAAAYDLSGKLAGNASNGVIIKNGKKYIRKQ